MDLKVKKLNLKSKSTGKKETGNRYITIFAKEQTKEEEVLHSYMLNSPHINNKSISLLS
jgi:hypothetical protein